MRQNKFKTRLLQGAKEGDREFLASARVADEYPQNPSTPADLHLEGSPGPSLPDNCLDDTARAGSQEVPTLGPKLLQTLRVSLHRAQRFLFGAVDPSDKEELERRLVASYQHMLLAILYPAALYFTVMAGVYYYLDGIVGHIYLGGMSALIAVACAAIIRDLSRRRLTKGELEFTGFALFAMIFSHLAAHHLFHLEPVKLILFMLLTLVTATASVSLRIAVSSIVICIPAMLWFAFKAGEEIAIEYAFISFAGTVVAFCMALLTRLTVMREIQAGIVANRSLDRAEYNANHDMLTELPNRRSFFRMLQTRLRKRTGAQPAFALVMIDLDGFKAVNDTSGHGVGDKLLFQVGMRLTEVGGENRFVARLGGDEFAIIVDHPENADALVEFSNCIRKEIEKPFNILGISIAISASVGIALDQSDIFSAGEIFERADYALYRAKNEKPGVIVFTPELAEERHYKQAVEHNLRHCNRAEEMYVVFHPQTDIRNGRTIGFEALARWENPGLGSVSPGVFIAAAERIGVIRELTLLLLEKALAAARDWPDPLKLSFNLSIRDIESSSAIDKICRIVRNSGFPAHRLEFEVTESLIMTDFKQARRSLRTLHDMGANVALDDFGTGYANFAHIDQLNINTIKIDRSFASRLLEGGNTFKVVKTMIDMCANLDIGCIVEGVENEAQLDQLRRIGACYIQGHHCSEPMSANDIASYLLRELQRDVSGTDILLRSSPAGPARGTTDGIKRRGRH